MSIEGFLLFLIIYSVLVKTLQDENNVELLKKLEFDDFNFGKALSTMTDPKNMLQKFLDSRFYDGDSSDDYLSYF